eukprot:TRINITY_DN3011_c0_g2_i1.p2 TRINITY_DN3011_c0_g2~~TRINITY_DN3011_c0_g2_i1.p2  ORF type:complete len:374 (-),score=111.07 TRINITY_DN3011_c0_g2_i1:169-1290(-)
MDYHRRGPGGVPTHAVYQNQPTPKGGGDYCVGRPTVMDPIMPVGMSQPPKVQHFQGYQQQAQQTQQQQTQQQPQVMSAPPAQPCLAPSTAAAAQGQQQQQQQGEQQVIREVLQEIRKEKSMSTTGEAELGVVAYWARGGKPDPYPCQDDSSQLVNGTASQRLPKQIPDWLAHQRPRYAVQQAALETSTVIERVKDIFMKTGSIYSGRAMYRTVRNWDFDGNGTISGAEFRAGLERYGVSMSDAEFHSIMSSFDMDSSGALDLREFLTALRGNLNGLRLKAVDIAFEQLDCDCSDYVTLHELQACYDPRVHPQVLEGKMDREQAMEDFLNHLDPNHDEVITRQEFLDFFTDISLSFDDDQQFLNHVRGMFRRRR